MPEELSSYPLFEESASFVPRLVPHSMGTKAGTKPSRGGRPRKYASDAEKKRAYRQRHRQATQHRAHYTGNEEWYTPAIYIEAARQVLGAIDLDPASSDVAQAVVQATRYYTKADNAFLQAWAGRVWLNPPYPQPLILYFITRLVAEYQAGHVTDAIVLTNNSTETAWFQRADAAATCLCFPYKRIRFLTPQGTPGGPKQAQVFSYFGTHPERFTEVFQSIGSIKMNVS